MAVEGSRAIGGGFPALGGEGMKLLERLVIGVKKMGVEMEKANARLESIEGVLREGAIEEADKIIDQGLNNKWLNLLKDGTLKEELRELEEENEVFWEFLRSRGGARGLREQTQEWSRGGRGHRQWGGRWHQGCHGKSIEKYGKIVCIYLIK